MAKLVTGLTAGQSVLDVFTETRITPVPSPSSAVHLKWHVHCLSYQLSIDAPEQIDLKRPAYSIASPIFEVNISHQAIGAGHPGLFWAIAPGCLSIGDGDLARHLVTP